MADDDNANDAQANNRPPEFWCNGAPGKGLKRHPAEGKHLRMGASVLAP